MNRDIIALVDFYEREKEIPRNRVIEALEFAFIAAYKKMVPGAERIETLSADIDERKGDTVILASLQVVADEDIVDQFNEVKLSLALKKNPNAQLGDTVKLNVTPPNFGRIAVQTAKQTIQQRLRMAEKERIYDEFKDRAGDVVSGTISRFERNDVWVNLGKFDGRMPSRERVNTEDYNIGDRLRFYVVAVENESRGPEIILSRSHPNFIRRLFEAEVTEIADQTIEIRGIAREAGFRTKMTVISHDENVDPVGACVGIRGARVKNIVKELNNEKIDIIPWDENPAEFIHEALKPANLHSVSLDQENKIVYVTVEEEELSKAIGRRGVNARLTSKLLGWEVEVSKDDTKHEIFESKLADASHSVAETLEITDELADALFRAGGASIDLIVQMPADYIAQTCEISEEEAAAILEKAAANLEQ